MCFPQNFSYATAPSTGVITSTLVSERLPRNVRCSFPPLLPFQTWMKSNWLEQLCKNWLQRMQEYPSSFKRELVSCETHKTSAHNCITLFFVEDRKLPAQLKRTMFGFRPVISIRLRIKLLKATVSVCLGKLPPKLSGDLTAIRCPKWESILEQTISSLSCRAIRLTTKFKDVIRVWCGKKSQIKDQLGAKWMQQTLVVQRYGITES